MKQCCIMKGNGEQMRAGMSCLRALRAHLYLKSADGAARCLRSWDFRNH
nr:MAG TPA: hypothetical protein [Caudoviricetes sp.]